MKKLNVQKLFFAALAALFLWGCASKQTLEEYKPDFGYNYFPLTIGKYVTYRIDSTIYDPAQSGTNVLKSTTFVKEIVVDTVYDNLLGLGYKVERYSRKSDTLPFEIQDVWATFRNETQAIRVEENLKFIKMVFPLKKGNTWDGNVFIDPNLVVKVAEESIQMFKNWTYQVLGTAQSFTLLGQNYPKVTTVEQAKSENLIELRESSEKYAEGIGLIYRQLRILDTQIINPALSWEQKAQKGFTVLQVMIDHN